MKSQSWSRSFNQVSVSKVTVSTTSLPSARTMLAHQKICETNLKKGDSQCSREGDRGTYLWPHLFGVPLEVLHV